MHISQSNILRVYVCCRTGFIGAVQTELHVSTAVRYATERCRQVRTLSRCSIS